MGFHTHYGRFVVVFGLVTTAGCENALVEPPKTSSPSFEVVGAGSAFCQEGLIWGFNPGHYVSASASVAQGCWERVAGQSLAVSATYKTQIGDHTGAHYWNRIALAHDGSYTGSSVIVHSEGNRQAGVQYSTNFNVNMPSGVEGIRLWHAAGGDDSDKDSFWIDVWTKLSAPTAADVDLDLPGTSLGTAVDLSWQNTEASTWVRTIIEKSRNGGAYSVIDDPNYPTDEYSTWENSSGTYVYCFRHASTVGTAGTVERRSDRTCTDPISVPLLTVTGPTHVKPNQTCTWTAQLSGGSTSSYEWTRSGNVVSNTNVYTGNSGSSFFFLYVEVDGGLTRVHKVGVSSNGQYC